MATTSVINNFDLLSSIIQCVPVANDLLSLSLASRSLSNLALDCLWRELPSSYYVLKLLPGFAPVDNVYTMTKRLEESDWTPFDRYSHRIHEIICLFTASAHGARQNIDVCVFKILQEYCPHTPLFPSIRFLRMSKHLPRIIGNALILMPLMTLMMWKIGLNAAHPSAQEYLERLSSLGSQPRVIRITGKHSLALTNAATRFKHLEFLDLNFHWMPDYFEVRPEYPDFPTLLNQLSDLEKLTSPLISPPTTMSLTPPLLTTGFRRLKRLAVTGDIHTFTTLCCMAPYIEYLVLEMLSPEEHTKWHPFFGMLQTSCPVLKDLRIYGRYIASGTPMSVLNHLKTLSGLPLAGLSIKSESPLSLTLSDTDVEEIARFWPGLTNLEIFPDGRYGTSNFPTIKAVKSILVGCVVLQYLHMSCGNKPTRLSTGKNNRSFTLDNTYPPFIKFGLP